MTSGRVLSHDETGIGAVILPKPVYQHDVDGTFTPQRMARQIDPARDPAIQEHADDFDFDGEFGWPAEARDMTEPVVLDFVRPLTTPFSEPVARRLAEYNRQIQALIDARLVYLRGVLDMLGIDESASVSIDLDTYSYRLPDRDEPR